MMATTSRVEWECGSELSLGLFLDFEVNLALKVIWQAQSTYILSKSACSVLLLNLSASLISILSLTWILGCVICE